MIDGYNNSKHRSIGLKPNDVNEKNEHLVRKTLNPKIKKKHTKEFSKPGDSVRILAKKLNFKKAMNRRIAMVF